MKTPAAELNRYPGRGMVFFSGLAEGVSHGADNMGGCYSAAGGVESVRFIRKIRSLRQGYVGYRGMGFD